MGFSPCNCHICVKTTVIKCRNLQYMGKDTLTTSVYRVEVAKEFWEVFDVETLEI